jgi:uncharacterized protein (DUF1778 family)
MYVRTLENLMVEATARINFRVPQETKTLLKTAARASDQSLTGFVISAAEDRARSVLDSYSLVSDKYFEELLRALDESPVPNDALRREAGANPVFRQR